MDTKTKLTLLTNIIELAEAEEDHEQKAKLQKLVNFKLDQIAADLEAEKLKTE